MSKISEVEMIWKRLVLALLQRSEIFFIAEILFIAPVEAYLEEKSKCTQKKAAERDRSSL